MLGCLGTAFILGQCEDPPGPKARKKIFFEWGWVKFWVWVGLNTKAGGVVGVDRQAGTQKCLGRAPRVSKKRRRRSLMAVFALPSELRCALSLFLCWFIFAILETLSSPSLQASSQGRRATAAAATVNCAALRNARPAANELVPDTDGYIRAGAFPWEGEACLGLISPENNGG